MPSAVERMLEALNEHDLDAFLGCFDAGYRIEHPAHPNRGFGGKEQVRKNWSSMFGSFPTSERSSSATPRMGRRPGASGTGGPRG